MRAGTFRGLSFGGNTPYILREITGVDDFESNAEVVARPLIHGGLPAGGYTAQREVILTLKIRSQTADPGQALLDLRKAFQPTRQIEHTLTFTHVDGRQLQFDCRSASRVAPIVRTRELVHRDITIRLLASDPRIYDQTEQTVALGTFTPAAGTDWVGGRLWPIIWSSGATPTELAADNAGIFETWPTYEIAGPSSGTLTNPIIEHLGDGSELRFTADGGLSIGVDQILVVDTHPARRDIVLTGLSGPGSQRWNTLALGSRFSPLQPGSTSFRFRAGGTTTDASLAIKWRNAEL